MALRRIIATLALLCCAACDSTDSIAPKPALVIAPNPPPPIFAGQRLQFTASGPTGVAVVWSSTNELVAQVDQQGIVTAVARGTTYVRAIAGEARDSVLIQVVPTPPKSGPTISFSVIRDGVTGAPINPAAVRGPIEVVASLDAPPTMNSGLLKVLVRDQTVCVEPVAGRSRFTHRCLFDSAQFANGPAQFKVQAVQSDGVIFAIAISQQLVLAN